MSKEIGFVLGLFSCLDLAGRIGHLGQQGGAGHLKRHGYNGH